MIFSLSSASLQQQQQQLTLSPLQLYTSPVSKLISTSTRRLRKPTKPIMQNISPQTSTDSTSSVEIGDCLFCMHGTERCETCNADFREDNNFSVGLDPVEREALKVDFTLNAKDGMPQCRSHKVTDCSKCFSFKKQIVKLNKEAEKMKKKQPKSTSNFV